MALKDLFYDLIRTHSQKLIASQIPINEKTFSAHLTGNKPNRNNADKYIAYLKTKGIIATYNEIYE